MAKYEARIKGDFDKVLDKLEKNILSSSKAISLKDKSDFKDNDIRCSIRVFAYYPMIGTGACLNITLFQNTDKYIDLSAISLGGFSFLPIKDGEDKLIETLNKILNEKFK